MTLEDRRAGASEYVVDSGHAISTRSSQLVACLIEASVEHLIVVAAELFDTLTGTDIPETRRSVNTARQAVISSEIELAARQLSRMAIQSEKAITCANVPDLRRVIE